MFVKTVGLHDIQLVGNKIYLDNNQLPFFESFPPELLQESSQKFVTINRHWVGTTSGITEAAQLLVHLFKSIRCS